METVRYLIFLGSKITIDGDNSHEIKRRLLLGRKAMPNLDSILKSRDIAGPHWLMRFNVLFQFLGHCWCRKDVSDSVWCLDQ